MRELLTQRRLREQLETLHGFLTRFRDLLSRQGGTITSGTELRLGVLRSLRRVVELLGGGFRECRSGRRLRRRGFHPRTLGADKGYDTRDFAKVRLWTYFSASAYNLVRMSRLLAAS